MRNFILRRLLQTLPMLLLASFIIFLLFAKTPGDFIDGNITLTSARAAELKAIYGLDQPLLTRYLHWLGQLLRGDLGFSLQYQIPVSQLLNQYIWNSFLLASVALVFYWGIGLAVGVVSALRPGSWFDHLVSVAVFAAMSFPTFFLCLLLIKWFAVDLHWLPVGGMTNTGSDESGWQYVLQVVVMYAGRIVEQGATAEVLRHPQHPYTRGLIASRPVPGERRRRLYSIPGQVPDLAALPAGCAFAGRCERATARCREAIPPLLGDRQRAACFYSEFAEVTA
ncbi:oligopeptide/dipeptide ABC transporter ATP-binding protein [Klebsiella pneumoniae]|uniref:oligopeptide/dipeptide ABC transporter ATP-binding protein n=1 Tax=Klebsiella pneumoniae TaxID=573 RepID=UPI000E2AFEAE|nr:oligopeptide/dipeptide ABC transporter ATP-binding protein [Klebsiella pneumoniae]SYG74758.1 Oligopeptide transport system permease OppB [Klebsiella pneumoniae]SYG79109.1 Oligopeptide transport system permease OppB [Klebsiella pneumoniae]